MTCGCSSAVQRELASIRLPPPSFRRRLGSHLGKTTGKLGILTLACTFGPLYSSEREREVHKSLTKTRTRSGYRHSCASPFCKSHRHPQGCMFPTHLAAAASRRAQTSKRWFSVCIVRRSSDGNQQQGLRKLYSSAEEAVSDIPSDITLLSGGRSKVMLEKLRY